LPRLTAEEILERAVESRRMQAPCRLCPRLCRIDRSMGEKGFCNADWNPRVASVVPHFGEEPPLCGSGGSGTIFFSFCNMRCVYCQNFQISRSGLGFLMRPEELADEMLRLQKLGCSNIEPVSPSHHLPGFLEALATAVERGLRLPVVYNTNGYETPETLALLDGIVDVYLPDMKYSDNDRALKYSNAADYCGVSRNAVKRMHEQVGDLVLDTQGKAVQGLLIRHLLLPDGLADTIETLLWIKENFPTTVTLSLMAQYKPVHSNAEFGELNRKLTVEEYDRAIDMAWDLGFENVFIQSLEASEIGVPDFSLREPFEWQDTPTSIPEPEFKQ
jgi:putative pyruvate formate lyase activating enzyme